MKCHYCGAELLDNDIFCRHCGTRRQNEAAEVAAAAAESSPVAEAPAAEAPAVVPVAAPEPMPVPAPAPAPVCETRRPAWQPYGAPVPKQEEPLFDFEKAHAAAAPKLQLPTRRGLFKMILFSILTFGIYPVVIWSRLVGEVNMVASRYDGERSMSFFGMIMLAPLTLGIHSLVWIHKLCRRIGAELQRRNLSYTFGPRDFWVWNVLLGFLSGVCLGVCSSLYITGFDVAPLLWALLIVGILTLLGPFIFTHKLMKSMNKLNGDYNVNG